MAKTFVKSPPASLETLLDREVEVFDQVMAEVRHGVRCPAHYDELEERADGIACRLRSAFRSCRKTV